MLCCGLVDCRLLILNPSVAVFVCFVFFYPFCLGGVFSYLCSIILTNCQISGVASWKQRLAIPRAICKSHVDWHGILSASGFY